MRGITLIFEHPLDSRRTRLRSLYFLARAYYFCWTLAIGSSGDTTTLAPGLSRVVFPLLWAS